MISPSLFDLSPVKDQPRRRLQRSSVDAYRQLDRNGRVRFVLDCLDVMSTFGAPRNTPTSAELYRSFAQPKLSLNYIRSGLSDAKKLGLVRNGARRKCEISHKSVLTWAVVTR